MRPYQERYLALLGTMRQEADLSVERVGAEAFVDVVRQASEETRQLVEEGTQLLREELFPLLDDILSASPEELQDLVDFADKLMGGVAQKDSCLSYRIHLALMTYARHKGDRDLLIRELYWTGMGLFNMENMLAPHSIRLYTVRMRMCFSECASHFNTDYDDITTPAIRGYIHRAMGNLALTYPGTDLRAATAKLAALKRSIALLSDPDVRAKTPSLPWDRYLLVSHQERTTMLGYLRSGHAGPDVFAQVLELAQIVQEHQLRQAREQDLPSPVRWQYAYYAALYHSGAMGLSEFLDVLYALSTAIPDDDMGTQSMFSHLGVPAYYMEYSRKMDERELERHAGRISQMIHRMCRWLATAITGDYNEQLMLHLRQTLYVYTEMPGCISFFELLQNVFAARHPTSYARMWRAGQIAGTLCSWLIDDCPEKLVGVLGCKDAGEVAARREELEDFANTAGRLYDAGMVHCFGMVLFSCRGLFEEEYGLLQLHTDCGAELLSRHPSVAMYADIAHGHHCRYDEKGGYPLGFSPRRSPLQPMIYLIAVADALTAATDDIGSLYNPPKTFDLVCRELEAESGGQYAPYVVDLLASPERHRIMRENLGRWTVEAYHDLYRRRSALLE